MKTRLICIGNSRGIRLPKAVIDQIGLRDEIELRVEDRSVILTSVVRPRADWADAAQDLGKTEGGPLDPPTSTRFDEDEWVW
jgi:antitoxin MazE